VLYLGTELRAVFTAQFEIGFQRIEQSGHLDAPLLRSHKYSCSEQVRAAFAQSLPEEFLGFVPVSRLC
jgi:hypothetical protein